MKYNGMDYKEWVAMKLAFRPADLHEITAQDVVDLCRSTIDPVVLQVATQGTTARFWRAGDRCFTHDPYAGDPVALDKLRYNSRFGLHSV